MQKCSLVLLQADPNSATWLNCSFPRSLAALFVDKRAQFHCKNLCFSEFHFRSERRLRCGASQPISSSFATDLVQLQRTTLAGLIPMLYTQHSTFSFFFAGRVRALLSLHGGLSRQDFTIDSLAAVPRGPELLTLARHFTEEQPLGLLQAQAKLIPSRAGKWNRSCAASFEMPDGTTASLVSMIFVWVTALVPTATAEPPTMFHPLPVSAAPTSILKR